jgi:hypothetical protein
LLIALALVFTAISVSADTSDLQDKKSVSKAIEQSIEFDSSINTACAGQGQVFYEDFDSGAWPTVGFPIIDSDFGSPETWVLGSYDYHTSPYSAEVWWAYPPPDQSEWLISKEITIGGSAELEFFSYVYLGSTYLDEFKVKVSPTGSTSHDDFVTIWDATNDYPPDTGWHYFTDPAFVLDLSPYGPGTIRIAFHADGTTSVDGGLWWIWLVDTVTIRDVEAPALEIGEISGGFGITSSIENTGTGDATDVEWSITLDGGLIILGKETTGMISTLAVDAEEEIKSGLILGIGKPTITVYAECAEGPTAEANATGFVLLFFVLNVA